VNPIAFDGLLVLWFAGFEVAGEVRSHHIRSKLHRTKSMKLLGCNRDRIHTSPAQSFNMPSIVKRNTDKVSLPFSTLRSMAYRVKFKLK
jgi:hypothetical protein